VGGRCSAGRSLSVGLAELRLSLGPSVKTGQPQLSVDGHQNLPADGHEEDFAAITESDHLPGNARVVRRRTIYMPAPSSGVVILSARQPAIGGTHVGGVAVSGGYEYGA